MHATTSSGFSSPSPLSQPALTAAIRGCLLGTALGDAIGLPAEGLPRRRQTRLFGAIDRHHFWFGRGMVSDDTEHTLLVAQALVGSAGELEQFARLLARQLRVWFALLPAGIGLATLRACLKLSVGVPPDRSGVFSAGNGPAMRAALLGVCYGGDGEHLRGLVRASSRITHTDPKAEQGALAVAWAAHGAATGTLRPAEFAASWAALAGEYADPELRGAIDAACRSVVAGDDTLAFAAAIGCGDRGVSGYVCHTVPVALHAALRCPTDFRAAVTAAVACGGDTDSVAAIVGGIVGAGVGMAGIPVAWRDGLAEWPRTVAWMERLATRLGAVVTTGRAARMLPVFLPAVALRNLLFLIVVLYHGARRLLPPY